LLSPLGSTISGVRDLSSIGLQAGNTRRVALVAPRVNTLGW